MSDRAENNNQQEGISDDDGFAERTTMALAVEAANLKDVAVRLGVLIAALALSYGVSPDV